jgi:haloacetate dehalogenase
MMLTVPQPSRRPAGRTVLALWGAEGFVGRHYDMLDVWRQYAATVTGRGLPCDHYLPEQAPAQTTAALLAFPACL